MDKWRVAKWIGATGLVLFVVIMAYHGSQSWKDASTSDEVSPSTVTAACPGGPESVTPGTNWLDLKNREKKCRIVARVKTGRVIFQGSAGETPPVGPEGGRWRDMIYYEVRGTTGSDEITIARCPQSTAHIQNIGWDCKSLKS